MAPTELISETFSIFKSPVIPHKYFGHGWGHSLEIDNLTCLAYQQLPLPHRKLLGQVTENFTIFSQTYRVSLENKNIARDLRDFKKVSFQGCSNHKEGQKSWGLGTLCPKKPSNTTTFFFCKSQRVENVLCISCQCHLARLSYKLNSVLNTRRECSILPWLETANSHKHRKSVHLVKISVLLI